LFIQLKQNDQDGDNAIKEIIINYRNLRKSDRQILTDTLNQKGIYQNQNKRIIMLDKGKEI
jgi:hypothetical protein